MGIASKIISVIIKSAVNSKLGDGLGSELIGISIDEYSAKGIDRIKDFINGEKSKIEHILSRENMKVMDVAEENIDFVVAELKDLLSKIEITDGLFRDCKYNYENLRDFLWYEYCRDKGIIESESDIKKGLYAVAKMFVELMRTSEEFEKDFLIQISNSVDDANVELQKISDYMHKNYGSMNEEIQMILVIVQMILKQIQNSRIEKQNTQKKIKNRTQEYADKWDANMFLNDFDKRDENAGVNVKLSDVYLDEHLPHYIWKENKKESNDLKDLLSEYVIPKRDNNMLLTLGQPGIGKSTLITWITANFTNRINDIFVYKFADDLAGIDWENTSEKHNIADDILMKLGFSYNELDGKTLIIDGFDEISIQGRIVILNKLFWQLIKASPLNNFSLIITSRENYIQDLHKSKFDYITLQSWDMEQIRSFCSIFQKKTKNSISESTIKKLLKNKEILGVPLILYMVLALNISIEKEGSIIDVYDKIFSLDGGIYDRCINNKSFAEPHRIGEVKKQIHQVSRDIAIWMFENNPGEASIPQEEYKKICSNIVKKHQKSGKAQQDFLIGNFFKLKHCEGMEAKALYFVHRTIYEYFVVETIYSSIEGDMIKLSEESQEKLAGNIAVYLKQGEIDHTIGEYLRYKILKLYNKFSLEKQGQFYPWWEKSIEKMMKMGMFYYTKRTSNYLNIFAKETQCFNNLIEILRLLFDTNRKQYILGDVDHVLFMRYIKHSLIECRIIYWKGMEIDNTEQVCDRYVLDLSRLNLTRANLTRTNLNGTDLRWTDLSNSNLSNSNLGNSNLSNSNLSNSNLSNSNLSNSNLSNSNLGNSNLSNSDLRKVNLRGVYLSRANLRGANLRGAIFDEKQIAYLEKEYNFNGTSVYIEETDEIISYEEYCRRRS